MKILVVSQYFDPENFRINEVCYELASRGHDVTVLTGRPNYPVGDIYEGYSDLRYEEKNGVKIHRVKLRPRKQGKVNLLRNYISFAYLGRKKARQLGKFDCVYVYEVSPVTQIIPGSSNVKKFGGKLIVNCLDLWPASTKVMGIKESSLLYKMILQVSKKIYHSSDEILIPSPEFKNYLKDIIKYDTNKINLLINHAEEVYTSYLDKTASNEKVIFLFAGNVGKAQNLDLIVDATLQLEQKYYKDILINIVGDGSYYQDLKTKVEKLNLSSIFEFSGRKSLEEMKFYYERANACILTLESNSEIAMTIPAKVQGYMASGKPIICTVGGSSRNFIENANCGIICEIDNVVSLKDAFVSFVNNKSEKMELGINGRKYFIDNCTLEKHVDKLLNYMELK